ncbi:GNAT family N-acetyltransferase [Streptantibioticus silvisoli]|uniref:GNAT family N-acetyltransferase n=1 Tax=Streptantibioticus silvisoli TaxID=2705255 RepID=A0ABT6VSE8_9ACTN|nr:GNAT family N-acetyltransferase [Streptantibioticus silvisoli]MDI5961409.1 GNAT family N-acetyltransferase [Streptantibioticus silvisoli]
MHSRTRTAYRAAGGVSEQELTGPAARARRCAAWARGLATSTVTTWCAERLDGTVIGLLAAGPPHRKELHAATHHELHRIAVPPHAWGQGVGGSLHREFIVRAAAAGCAEGVLGWWASDARARRCDARRTWRPDGAHRPGPRGSDYLRLRLPIDPSASQPR